MTAGLAADIIRASCLLKSACTRPQHHCPPHPFQHLNMLSVTDTDCLDPNLCVNGPVLHACDRMQVGKVQVAMQADQTF